MIGIDEIKGGKTIVLFDEPYVVLSHEHSKTGRAGAVLRTKLKNLVTGAIVDKTFHGVDKVDEPVLSRSTAQFLYHDGDDFHFMDNESFEQFSLPKDVLGTIPGFLVEGTEVQVQNWNGNAINVEIPVKVTLTVTDAPPNVKGDTSSGGDKVVTLETGLTITTPLFVVAGDKVIVNTDRGTYVSRA